MKTRGPNYMAIDQFGETFHDLGRYPRKALLARLNAMKASKMYADVGRGAYHVGYIIGHRWLTLYEVTPFRRKA